MQDVGRTHWTKSLTSTTDRLTKEAVARHRLRRFPRGTLLIPKSGASVNLNHRALLGTDAYVVSHLAAVVPKAATIDAEYLYYWSLTYDPRHQAQTTSLPSLPTALIKAARLPVPSIQKQRRIVDPLGELLATGEQMLVHVDMREGRSVAMPLELLAKVLAIRAAHAALPIPAQAGQPIGIRRKTP